VDNEWQHKQNRRHRLESREEFSFLVNSSAGPGIGLTGDRVWRLGKQLNLWAVRCSPDGPWKSGGV